MCPVTLQEMNGSHAFVVLFTTGWVMAEKATKEVGIAGLQVIARDEYASSLLACLPTICRVAYSVTMETTKRNRHLELHVHAKRQVDAKRATAVLQLLLLLFLTFTVWIFDVLLS